MSQTLRKQDLFLDELMIRKIKRAELAEQRGIDDSSDQEPDEAGDVSMLETGAHDVKRERTGGARGRRRVMEDVEDD